MNKYKPGGRCGGTDGSQRHEKQGDLPIAALLAARESQDKAWMQAQPNNEVTKASKASSQGPLPQNSLIVIPQNEKNVSKHSDIDFILEGDCD